MTHIVAAIVAALAGHAVSASPHPIHTTLTVITVAADHRSATLSLRVFADDFSVAVARAAGKTAPRDSSAAGEDITRYVAGRFTIDGAALEPCGVERTLDAYVLCFRATIRSGAASIVVRNLMLAELHDDQVNIVQTQGGRARQTHLFTKRSQPAQISLR